jgi:hypothetical protein
MFGFSVGASFRKKWSTALNRLAALLVVSAFSTAMAFDRGRVGLRPPPAEGADDQTGAKNGDTFENQILNAGLRNDVGGNGMVIMTMTGTVIIMGMIAG